MNDKINESIINKIKGTHILQPVEGWVEEYPVFKEIVDQQMHTFWPWDEPNVENDVQDLRVNMTEAERHGVTEVLKLFTLYECEIGHNYWANKIGTVFKRPELQRMATMFAAVEYNSHAPMYNEINRQLFIDTKEFYESYKLDPYLKERMSFIGKAAADDNLLTSLGAFSMLEGAVLYSSFAFLKHFQTQYCGKHMLTNVNRGIDLSVADENAHAVAGALLFNMIKQQANLSEEEVSWINTNLIESSRKVVEHEYHIIDNIFSKGEIANINISQMRSFVNHRVNLCLENLGIKKIYEESDDTIKDWFYKDINSVKLADFFVGSGSEYTDDWHKVEFGKVWG